MVLAQLREPSRRFQTRVRQARASKQPVLLPVSCTVARWHVPGADRTHATAYHVTPLWARAV